MTALSIAAAQVRTGLANHLRPVSRRVDRIAGALLAVSGLYLGYYWARLQFGPSATLASDPVVGPATRYAARLAILAQEQATALLVAAAVVVAMATAGVTHTWNRQRNPTKENR